MLSTKLSGSSLYRKKQIQKNITQPVRTGVVHPIYNFIDTSGTADNIPEPDQS